MSTPSITTLPSVGTSSAPRIFSSVDFPLPHCPMMATNSPLRISISIPCSTGVSTFPKYVFFNPCVATTISFGELILASASIRDPRLLTHHIDRVHFCSPPGRKPCSHHSRDNCGNHSAENVCGQNGNWKQLVGDMPRPARRLPGQADQINDHRTDNGSTEAAAEGDGKTLHREHAQYL